MAEYNSLYLDLKKRLNVLKLKAQTECGLTEEQKRSKLFAIDSLLKLLDERYSENLYLECIDESVSRLEGK